MNAKLFLLAVAVAVIGAAALMMCDDSDAAAGDVLASGSCGTTLTYEVRSLNADDSQVEVVIGGSGEMTSRSQNQYPWSEYSSKITSISLPHGLINIPQYAFYQTKITTLTLPDTLRSLGWNSFYGSSLISVVISSSVKTIESQAFRNCTNLAEVINYSRLNIVADSSDFGWIASNAKFVYTSTSDHPYTHSIQSDYRTASEVILPDSLTSIGKDAFKNCTNLAQIDFPRYLTHIGSSAFEGCTALARINISESVSEISQNTFYKCDNLVDIYVSPENNNYMTLDGALLTKPALTLMLMPAASGRTEYIIPDTVTTIAYGAFYNCSTLESIGIPDGVTTISTYAFQKCRSLGSITIPNTVTTINYFAFIDCPNLKSATMPALTPSNSLGAEMRYLETITYTSSVDWPRAYREATPQYQSMNHIQSITFASDYIPTNALYGQHLDRITITNASGPDYLGIYTAPNVKATASALNVDGTAAYIVRLTDVAGTAELLDGGINLNNVDVHWDTSPHGYATGEVDASPEVLVYPAGIHTSAPNQYAGLINAIPLIVIVAIITTIIGMMAVRRD